MIKTTMQLDDLATFLRSSVACFAPSNITPINLNGCYFRIFDFTKSTISHVSNRQFVFASSFFIFLGCRKRGFTMLISFALLIYGTSSYTCRANVVINLSAIVLSCASYKTVLFNALYLLRKPNFQSIVSS